MKADMAEELKEIEQIKKTISETRRILTTNLLLSSLYVLLGFAVSYWVTLYRGITVLSVMFLMFAFVGFCFIAKTLLGFQKLFETQQETRRVETEILEYLNKDAKEIDDNESHCNC